MSAQAIGAGASSSNAGHWHGIDWASCYRDVRRLQTRIVKATKEGRWNKVKALQWLLTHSFSGKALAVRRVTENQGKKTPGIDNITWSTPEDKYLAIEALKRRGYKPKPLRRIYLLKSNGKRRPLSIPCMIDRAQQALYLLALEPISETTADPDSYGFRPERSTADAMQQCFTLLARKVSPQWILEGDIRSCFDEISHEWLMAHVPIDKAILKRWLKAGYIEDQQLWATEAGVPQGGIISPAIANWALDGLQRQLLDAFGSRRARKHNQINYKIGFVRYCDDFIVTGYSKEFLENEVKTLVESFLRERGLTLSPEKTRITHIEEGFDFLGQNVRKYKGKLLIKPSKKNTTTFLKKIRTVINENKAVEQSILIGLLNPLIRGWADYHKHVVSKATYNTVDHEIWKKLWQWCRRRHRNKNYRWIKERYFPQMGARNWIFATSSEGESPSATLKQAADVPIRRHTKIKSDANPFDPAWESYFEERHGMKMLNTLAGYKRLIRLWFDQQGLCPVCHQRISKETGWHVHHIVRRIDGGGSTIPNLVMVHPTCHNQIHSFGLIVEKPAPAKGL